MNELWKITTTGGPKNQTAAHGGRPIPKEARLAAVFLKVEVRDHPCLRNHYTRFQIHVKLIKDNVPRDAWNHIRGG